MRPIERGPRPLGDDGEPKRYARYQQARGDLIARLGECCSYCEARLPASLAVEHVQPKSLNRELEVEWDNFLLGCTNCNSIKGDRGIALADYYWPDTDNTARAIAYLEEGIVDVETGLDDEQATRAQRTIELVGLDRTPDNEPEASDRRWLNRREAWHMARRACEHLENSPDHVGLQEIIVDLARAKGHWSIWAVVFRTHPGMLRRIAAAFPGTASDCFDDEMLPVPRPGGAI